MDFTVSYVRCKRRIGDILNIVLKKVTENYSDEKSSILLLILPV